MSGNSYIRVLLSCSTASSPLLPQLIYKLPETAWCYYKFQSRNQSEAGSERCSETSVFSPVWQQLTYRCASNQAGPATTPAVEEMLKISSLWNVKKRRHHCCMTQLDALTKSRPQSKILGCPHNRFFTVPTENVDAESGILYPRMTFRERYP